MKCLNCSFFNSDDARFCQQCGSRLSNAEASSHLQGLPALQSTPTGLAASEPGTPNRRTRLRPTLAGERRIVTVLFADVVGSTALAERMDPEEWTGIMNRAFDLLTSVIARFDGTVARLMGDGLLAFFGAPRAHEDDPVRAASAALEMIETARVYAAELRESSGIEFAIRIGLNTGPVVVGQVGSRQIFEYTAMGDAVNLAARLQTAARPLTVLVAEALYKTLAPSFNSMDRGMLIVRGKNVPVHVYEITGRRVDPARLRGDGWQDSPLVGRVKELAVLTRIGQDVQAGTGRICILVGEPGIGKSRLVMEWKARLPIPDVAWVEGRCQAYGQNLAYHLVIDLLHSILSRYGAEDSKPQSLQACARDLLGEAAGEVYPYLAHLLSIDLNPADRERVRHLDPQALQRQYIRALQILLKSLAARQPLFLFLDDVHWADPSSVEVIGKLVSIFQEAPVLFCFLTRPDRDAPGWKLVRLVEEQYGSSLTELSLKPLSQTSSARLATNLLGAGSLPPGIEKKLLSKADGNPLFVEELVHMLLDRGILSEQQDGRAARELENLDIPDTLQSLLLSHIDRLPEEARFIIHIAAVIGRQFSMDVLRAVFRRLEWDDNLGGGENSLITQVRLLETAGLISARKVESGVEYTFRHTLVHDAAYLSLLKSERQGYHQVVGEILEQTYAGRLEEHASLLAEHFWRAGDQPRARRYFTLAAESAAQTYALAEAISAYTRVLALTGDEMPAKIQVWQTRGDLLELTGDFEGARADQEAALAAAREIGDRTLEWRSLVNLGKLWAAIDYRKTGRYLHQALKLAREIGDPRVLAHSLNRLGNYYTNTDQSRLSRRYLAEALAIFEQLDDLAGIAETTDLVGMASALGGDSAGAVVFTQRASSIFEKTDDRRGLTSALATLALSSPNNQTDMLPSSGTDVKAAIQLGEKALQIATEIGWRSGEVFALACLSQCYCAYGAYDRAKQSLVRGLQIAREINHRQWILLIHSMLGNYYLDILDGEQAQIHFAEALAISFDNRSIYWQRANAGFLATALVHCQRLADAAALLERLFPPALPAQTMGQRVIWCARADLALAQGSPAQALQLTEKLIHESVRYRPGEVIIRVWLLRSDALTAMARAETDPARRAELFTAAESVLAEVLADVRRFSYRSRLWRIYSRQARVYAERGEQDLAEQARAAAKEALFVLSESSGDPGFRTRALGRISAITK